MDRIAEFIAILSDKHIQQRTTEARDNHKCKICNQPAETFVNALSAFEYQISTICQECQNYFFGGEGLE